MSTDLDNTIGFVEQGKKDLFANDYRNTFHISPSVCTRELRYARTNGLMRLCGNGSNLRYEISEFSDTDEMLMTKRQEELLVGIYEQFGKNQFTRKNVCDLFGLNDDTFYYHVQHLYEIGVFNRKKIGNQYHYWLTENSELVLKEPSVSDMLKSSFHTQRKTQHKKEKNVAEKLEAGIKGKRQQEILDMIRERFGKEEFTIRSAYQSFSMDPKIVDFHTRRLYKQGFLQRRKVKQQYVYWLTETDRSVNENDSEQIVLETNLVTTNPSTTEEQQAEQIRARLAQKHPLRAGIPQETALVAVG